MVATASQFVEERKLSQVLLGYGGKWGHYFSNYHIHSSSKYLLSTSYMPRLSTKDIVSGEVPVLMDLIF